jgi:hypothetical protein
MTPIGVALAIDVVRLTLSATTSAAAHVASTNKSPSLSAFAKAWLAWRRRWDLNPRKVALHTISNRADSAALALLLNFGAHLFEMNTGSQGYWSRRRDPSGSLFNAEVHSSGRVPCDDRL